MACRRNARLKFGQASLGVSWGFVVILSLLLIILLWVLGEMGVFGPPICCYRLLRGLSGRRGRWGWGQVKAARIVRQAWLISVAQRQV
jgi:hypothetical protein